MSQGGHSEPLLLLALFYQSTPSWLKVRGWWGGVGGPCDYCVSPSPFGLDFGTLGLWDFGLGLDKNNRRCSTLKTMETEKTPLNFFCVVLSLICYSQRDPAKHLIRKSVE